MRRAWGTVAVAAAAVAVATAQGAIAGAEDVTVARAVPGGLKPCGEVRVEGAGAYGGCDLDALESNASFAALTLFGDRPLGRCGFSYRLRIGGDGKLAITDVEMPTPSDGVRGICGDILPCRPDLEQTDEIVRVPWTGAVAKDGDGWRADVDVCFDTCYGRFEGRTRFELEETPRGWRMTADGAALGTSGFEISGGWEVRPYYGGELRLGGG